MEGLREFFPEERIRDSGADETHRTPPKPREDAPALRPNVPPTVLPLEVAQVRWFFRDPDLSEDWMPFCEHDSEQLELEYRFQTRQPVAVRGNMFDVDISELKMRPACHVDEPLAVLRGSWFHASGSPCEMELAVEIEELHQSLVWYKPSSTPEAGATRQDTPTTARKRTMPLHTQLVREKYNVYWYAEDDVRIRTRTTLMSFSSSEQAVHRGFHKLDESTPGLCRCGFVTHLVFVCHGIGQSMILAPEDHINRATSIMRKRVEEKLSSDKLVNPNLRNGQSLVEFIPLDWRSELPIDTQTILDITPELLEAARGILNATVLDVMYFTSPRYRQTIIDHLTMRITTAYANFLQRHPYFEEQGGLVSMIGHSLGGVLLYEILAHQDVAIPLSDDQDLRDEMEIQILEAQIQCVQQRMARRRNEEPPSPFLVPPSAHNVLFREIPFQVNALFTFGSPIAVFLALKGASSDPTSGVHGEHKLLPMQVRYYNIFHANDPVAYRMEPLVFPREQLQPPMPIKTVVEEEKAPQKTLASRMSEFASMFLSRATPAKAAAEAEDGAAAAAADDASSVASSETIKSPTDADKGRIDFVLDPGPSFEALNFLSSRDSTFQLLRQLYLAHTAHSCYWSNNDVAEFIARRLDAPLPAVDDDMDDVFEDEVAANQARARAARRELWTRHHRRVSQGLRSLLHSLSAPPEDMME
eukprot:m.165262 g.165262  ORF g.165262 m.165262 type:complete len:700 (+) comp10326_c2_seq1:810-2909(+)